MSDLHEERAWLADALRPIANLVPGFQVYDHLPEMLNGPCAVIEPGDPYLTEDDQTFCSMQVNYFITLVANVGTNKKATEDLDALITALLSLDVDISEIGQPIRFQYNTATHLGAVAKYASNITTGDSP